MKAHSITTAIPIKTAIWTNEITDIDMMYASPFVCIVRKTKHTHCVCVLLCYAQQTPSSMLVFRTNAAGRKTWITTYNTALHARKHASIVVVVVRRARHSFETGSQQCACGPSYPTYTTTYAHCTQASAAAALKPLRLRLWLPCATSSLTAFATDRRARTFTHDNRLRMHFETLRKFNRRSFVFSCFRISASRTHNSRISAVDKSTKINHHQWDNSKVSPQKCQSSVNGASWWNQNLSGHKSRANAPQFAQSDFRLILGQPHACFIPCCQVVFLAVLFFECVFLCEDRWKTCRYSSTQFFTHTHTHNCVCDRDLRHDLTVRSIQMRYEHSTTELHTKITCKCLSTLCVRDQNTECENSSVTINTTQNTTNPCARTHHSRVAHSPASSNPSSSKLRQRIFIG